MLHSKYYYKYYLKRIINKNLFFADSIKKFKDRETGKKV